MSTNNETTLRESLAHDCETPCEVPFDDSQQRIRKFRILSKMLALVAQGKRIEARVLRLNGENVRTHIFRSRVRNNGGRSNGTPQRKSVRVLRQAHFRVLDLKEATLLYLELDFGLVRRRRVVVTAMRPRRLRHMCVCRW